MSLYRSGLAAPTAAVPDFFEPLTGWRVWELRGTRLRSWMVSTRWPQREALEADTDSWSAGGTALGIHAFRHRDDIDFPYTSTFNDDAIGSVWLWGEVVEHRNGYRAQFAYPRTLWAPRKRCKALSEAYGVPCYPKAWWPHEVSPLRRRWLAVRQWISQLASGGR